MPRTDKELLEIASKYETRGAWRKGDSASNSTARKRGKEFFELCCAHMQFAHESWTNEKIQIIADKYETRNAWQTGDVNSYVTAHGGLYGDLDSFCAHMHKVHNFYSYHHMMSTEESQNTARLSPPCVTYFIKIKLPCNMIVYKIGYTHDFDSRCSAFVKENVEVIEVIDIVHHDNQFDAMTYEHECQNHNDALGFNAGLLTEQKFAGYTECYSQLEHKGISYKN